MTPETKAVAATVKAALAAAKAAALAADPPTSAVYVGDPRDEDHPLPRHYQVVHVTTGAAVGSQRLDGRTSPSKYRISVRSGGMTYDEAAWETDRAKDALQQKSLTLAGFDWQRNIDESDRTIAPDFDLPDWYEGSRVWSTIITPSSG